MLIGWCMFTDTYSLRYVDRNLTIRKALISMQLAGQRKKEDTGVGVGSTFVGLRTPYWG
jgi:glycerol kinase